MYTPFHEYRFFTQNPRGSVVVLGVNTTVRSLVLPAAGRIVLGKSITLRFSNKTTCTGEPTRCVFAQVRTDAMYCVAMCVCMCVCSYVCSFAAAVDSPSGPLVAEVKASLCKNILLCGGCLGSTTPIVCPHCSNCVFLKPDQLVRPV